MIFTPLTTCDFLTIATQQTLPVFAINYGFQGSTELACLPPGFNADYGGALEYYSPGVCPLSWELVPSTQVSDFVSDCSLYIADFETVRICYPSGFGFSPSIGYCASFLETSTFAAYAFAGGNGQQLSVVPTSTAVSQVNVRASFVQVRWRFQDTASSTSPAASTSTLVSSFRASTTPTSATLTAATTLSELQPTTTNNNGGGYSESDRISLGVGIGIGLPATIAVILTPWYMCTGGSACHLRRHVGLSQV
jgi:hypothetical protein